MLNRNYQSNNSSSYKDLELTLEDGIKLISRIWVPNGCGPWPALIMRQPYGREIASTVTYAHPSWWASYGYLVIIQDVRGQGESGGKFKGFVQEASDTTQTHKWVRSLKECNGKIGTYGFSYQGLTQLVALPETPPPDCLAPAMTGLNENIHWSCDGNAYWWHLGLAWGLQLAALKAKRNKDIKAWELIRLSLESGNYLREGESLLKEYDPEGMSYQWLLNSNEINQPFLIHKPLKTWLKKPMLLIGGWWDPHLKGILDIYQQSLDSGGYPELYIGDATHLKWWEKVQDLHLKFFDLHLKGKNNSITKKLKVKIWNITTEEWKPLKNNDKYKSKLKSLEWGFFSSGKACFDNSEGLLKLNQDGEGWFNLVHDPWRPVPSLGGHLSESPGKSERGEIDKRLDVAVFTSPSLEKDLFIEGIPTIEIIAESDQKGFDICVALSVVSKNNLKTIQLSTGFLRVIGEQATKSDKRRILLQPISALLRKNEYLRISFSGSCWPAIGINPGNGENSCGPPTVNCLISTQNFNLNKSKLEIFPLLGEKTFR